MLIVAAFFAAVVIVTIASIVQADNKRDRTR